MKTSTTLITCLALAVGLLTGTPGIRAVDPIAAMQSLQTGYLAYDGQDNGCVPDPRKGKGLA